MSNKTEKALMVFGSGFNCAQAVISVFCEDYSLNQCTAAKLACGLGGGFRSGDICGAVSGAILVIGLKHGQGVVDDVVSKKLCYAKTEEFLKAYKNDNNSIVCRELLGIDISTEEGRKQAQDQNLFRVKCDKLVESAISLLEEQGY